jgi:hypothetical protein
MLTTRSEGTYHHVWIIEQPTLPPTDSGAIKK